MVKKIKYILSIVSIFTLIFLVNVNAKLINLRDAVNDPTGELYKTTYDLLIDKDDLPYLNQTVLSKFSSLSFITLRNVYIDNGQIINYYNHKIEGLYIENAVVNLSTFSLDNVKEVNVLNSFNTGNLISADKITFGTGTFLNEEYARDPEYDNKITEVAQDIYNQSNKTADDIIRKTTLYVVNNLTYDNSDIYGNMSLSESIFKRKIGLCEHYAYLESQILNKLGIFTMNVVGYVDKTDPLNTTHAWNVLYVNGKWYSLDPTWMDTAKGRQDLQNNKSNKYYMRALNDNTFNADHVTYFTNFDLIPTSSRVSKMSIATPVKAISVPKKTTTTTAAKPKAAPILENPETGAFVSFVAIIFAYFLARGMLYVSKKKTVFYKI